MDPDVRALVPALLVQALERAIQFGVELSAHEQAAERFCELRAEPTVSALHEAADERGWDGRELVLCEAPVPVSHICGVSCRTLWGAR